MPAPHWPATVVDVAAASGPGAGGHENLAKPAATPHRRPEAFGFAVLACGLVALGRLCGQHRIFSASLGALAYLEAFLLLGIAVTGLIPYNAGYNRLSLAAGAVLGLVLSVWLGPCLGRPKTQAPA